jgi:quercetin dioxygenase-like cupin family protein
MTPSPVRRVITGHAPDKKAIVVADGAAAIVNAKEQSVSTTVWSSPSIPAIVEGEGLTVDPATYHKGSGAPRNGARLMIMDLAPGAKGKMHRTNTVDLVICLEGEIEMLLPDSSVRLKAGEILIQQSTIHAWTNPGKVRARLAITLIDAVPLGPEFPPAR